MMRKFATLLPILTLNGINAAFVMESQ